MQFSSINNNNPSVSHECLELLDKLKTHYLSELQSLHDDCAWLRNLFKLDGKKNLQISETKLLQFAASVDFVVSFCYATTC